MMICKAGSRVSVWGMGILAILASGCERHENQITVNVRLKWLFFPNYAGAPVARARGFFPQNWKVEIRSGGFAANSITMVESGSDLFGITSALELLQARARRMEVVALCAVYQMSPVSFLTLKDSGITRLQHFRGKRGGIKYGTNTELIYLAMLRRHKISPDEMDTTPVKFRSLPLVERQVDVFPSYYMTDPVNLAASGAEVHTINPQSYGIKCYGNIIFTTSDTIRQKPRAVAEFVRAYVEGWRWAVANVQQTARLFAELNDANPYESHVAILKRTIPYLVVEGSMERFGSMTKETWEGTLAFLREDPDWSELPFANAVTVEEAFTTDFILRTRE